MSKLRDLGDQTYRQTDRFLIRVNIRNENISDIPNEYVFILRSRMKFYIDRFVLLTYDMIFFAYQSRSIISSPKL